jgi:hypothetical protein
MTFLLRFDSLMVDVEVCLDALQALKKSEQQQVDAFD